MKLVAGFVTATLVGLSQAGPVSQNSDPIEELTETFWMVPTIHEITGSMDETHKTKIRMSTEKIPNGGNYALAKGVCQDIDFDLAPWCPDTADQAMEVFSNIAAVHLMPNSVANGELDESEIINLAGGMYIGGSGTYDNHPTIPDPIDNSNLVFGDGSANDVYRCGPDEYEIEMWNWWSTGNGYGPYQPTPGWTLDSAPATHSCLTIGAHGGYGDTFEPFTMNNVQCEVDDGSNSKFVLCGSFEGANSARTNQIEMSQANIDLVKEAFALLNDPASAYNVPPTTAPPATEAPTTSAPSPAAGNNNMKIAAVVVILVIVAVLGFTQMKK
jgi:hypothetical protein